MALNIFVIGLDEPNHQQLRLLPGAADYEFHQLLTLPETQDGTVSVSHLLDKAHRQLGEFDGSIDAIMGFWDFPVNMLVPILCSRYGLISADLEAVVKCEHKYWSRLAQQKVIDEYPAFGLIDLGDPDATLPEHMSYPAWIKPIMSKSSEGAHPIDDDGQLQRALEDERQVGDRLGGPFNEVLELLELPDDISGIGSACMVEEAAVGEQFTVEGFARGEHVEIYGVIDALTYEDSPSFLRYRYPSTLPTAVRERMSEVSRRTISAVGLRNSTFNIEYFWEAETERLNVLEVNTRHSQSHAPLFERVDGRPNHSCMIDLALDREPRVPGNAGEFKAASKWFLRHFSDGVVRRAPTALNIEEIEKNLPGTSIDLLVEQGTRLSAGGAEGEDSFSHTLAEIVTVGIDDAEVVENYRRCLAALDLEIDDLPRGA